MCMYVTNAYVLQNAYAFLRSVQKIEAAYFFIGLNNTTNSR